MKNRSSVVFAALMLCGVVSFGVRAAQAGPQDQMLYDAVRQGDTVSDLAFVLRHEGDRTLLEVSVLSKGKGAQARRWLPEKPFLTTQSGRITPVSTSPFYVPKPSVAGGVAPLLFAAIGSQYVGNASRAADHSGSACPAPTEPQQHKGVHEAIDRTGMAVGMGLLASQARGEYTGMRATFDVTGHESELAKALFKSDITNRDSHRTESITVPLKFDIFFKEAAPAGEDDPCKKARDRMRQAQAQKNDAEADYDAAKKALDGIDQDLAKETDEFNRTAKGLGLSGKATTDGTVTFGQESRDPSFLDKQAYKDAKAKWEKAKAGNRDAKAKAEGEVDRTGARRNRARDEYEDAKAEYEKCIGALPGWAPADIDRLKDQEKRERDAAEAARRLAGQATNPQQKKEREGYAKSLDEKADATRRKIEDEIRFEKNEAVRLARAKLARLEEEQGKALQDFRDAQQALQDAEGGTGFGMTGPAGESYQKDLQAKKDDLVRKKELLDRKEKQLARAREDVRSAQNNAR